MAAVDLLKQRLAQSHESSNYENLDQQNNSESPSCSYVTLELAGSNQSRSSTPTTISQSNPSQSNFSSDSESDLTPYSSNRTLRQIEEHGQYDALTNQHERKFKCQYCYKKFVRKEEKLRHERSHTNERKYQCRHPRKF